MQVFYLILYKNKSYDLSKIINRIHVIILERKGEIIPMFLKTEMQTGKALDLIVANKIINKLENMDCKVKIIKDSQTATPNGVLQLLSLNIKENDVISIEFDGPDALQVRTIITTLLK